MIHLKRQKVPKNWPIDRKGTTFVVKGTNLKAGIPLLIVLRDILKVAKTRKEVKRAMNENYILVNGKPAKEEKNSLTIFDTIGLVPSKKYYALTFSEKGKFTVEEISEKDSTKKISKVMDKKVLKGKKTQLNLLDGRNYLSDIKCNVEDSVVIDLKTGKIERCLEIKKGASAMVFQGKHAGKKGKISEVDEVRKMVEIQLNKDEKINVLQDFLMVVE